jgi:hypothetical protein
MAFDNAHGKAPFNYVLGKSHDGWRTFLPFLIDMAKSNTTSFSQENVVAWYREHSNTACGTGGTTGNTASQLQQTYAPGLLAQDIVFYAALLGSPASVSVSIGGQSVAGSWTVAPSGNGAGLDRGAVSMGGRTGNVVVSITRSGSQIVQASGDPITTACTNSIENWNANVITGNGHSIAPVSPLSLSDSVCTSGFGAPKYLDLCSFACKYGYCPAVCTCTSLVGSTPCPFLWPIGNKTANSSRVLPSRNLLPRMWTDVQRQGWTARISGYAVSRATIDTVRVSVKSTLPTTSARHPTPKPRPSRFVFPARERAPMRTSAAFLVPTVFVLHKSVLARRPAALIPLHRLRRTWWEVRPVLQPTMAFASAAASMGTVHRIFARVLAAVVLVRAP